MIAFDMDGTLHGGTGEVFQSAAGIYYLTFSSIRYCFGVMPTLFLNCL